MGRYSFTAAARACFAFVACLGFVLPVGCSAPTQNESSTASAASATLTPQTLEGAYEPTDGLNDADETAIASVAFDGSGTYYLWRNKGCNQALQDDCPAPETGSYSLTANELTLLDANTGLTAKLPLELGLGATSSSGLLQPQDQTVQTGAPVAGGTANTVSQGGTPTTTRRNVAINGRGYQLLEKKKLPPFDDLWKAYPHEDDSSLVKKQIGGAVNADWITNTCTVRLSAALNGAGMLLPNGPSSTTSGLHTVKGGDGLNYAYRVSEMRDYLNKTVGPAPIVLTGNQITPDAIKGQTGIIAFSVPFSDATGHFDLWDGSAPAHAEYFSRATKVEFWPTQ